MRKGSLNITGTQAMNTEDVPINRAMEPLKQRRLWYVLALALAILSVVVRQPLVLLAALLTFVIAFVPELWYRRTLRYLEIWQEVDQHHLFFGEEVIFSMSIENQKFLPLSWLRVENPIIPPLTILNEESGKREKIGVIENVWMLWSLQRVTRCFRLRGYARGMYTFGPVKLRSGDPFGWLVRDLTLPMTSTLLIYPPIVPLADFDLSFLHPSGEHLTLRCVIEDPLRIAGIRDYQIGDDPRRIHWKATARTGSLRSKIYEHSSSPRLLLLLDVENYSRAWMGIDLEMQEMCISLAASLAVMALDEGCMVGLLTNGAVMTPISERVSTDQMSAQPVFEQSEIGTPRVFDVSAPGVSVPFALNPGQYERLLSTLARLVPYESCKVEALIDREESLFENGATIILISAATTLKESIVERLLDRRRGGAAVYLVLLGDEEGKDVTETYDLPVHYLGREKWHELVQAVSAGKGEVPDAGSRYFSLD